MGKITFEFSSGGVVIEDNKVLLIKVENLKGEKVWTFPKGHIEKNERAPESALREVEEETGYRCKILKQLDSVQYWFKDEGKLIKKTVKWFLMDPVKKNSKQDKEVIKTGWFETEKALEILSYKSDRKTLENI